MAKNTDLRTEIVITCNAKNADAEIKNIKKSIKALDKEINDLSKQGKGDSPYAKWLRKLRSSLNSFQRESVKGAERVQKAVENLAGTSTNELRRARRAAQQFRDSLAANDPQFAKANANLAKIQAQIDKNTGAVRKHGSAWKTTIKNMMAYVGVFGMLNMVKSKIEEIVGLNLKFSQQLADVRKVSGLTTQQIKDLGNELSKIDSRTSLQGLMTTAYSGAKLGFGEYGTKGLVDFTKAANVASVAIGEELGEDALPALSKIVENMGIIKKYGIEQSMLKTASAMFKLSSSSTATSNNIVEFSKRLTAMSKVAGITTDQLLALGSASDAMYLAPEVSATAFTKLISSIQTSHNLIEKTLGMTKGTINDLFSKGKAMDAIVQIFEKMNKLGNMNALKPIFKDLGSDGARLMNVMTAMAKNVDVLKNHLNMSAEAFREGTAATAEYNIQQETAEGLMERAKNLWQKAVMNPEEVDVVHEFAKAWYEVSNSITTNKFAMAILKAAISELMFALKALLYLLPGLVVALGTGGLFWTVMQLSSAIRTATSATKAFSVAWSAMSKATKATWIGLIVGTVVELTYALYSFAKAANENAIPSLGKLNMSLDGFKATLRRSTSELDDYRRAIDKAGMKTQERAAAIANFNKMYGRYLKNMLSEAATAKDVADAYQQVVSALQAKLALEGKQADIKKYVQPRMDWSASKLQTYNDYNNKAGGHPERNAEWLKGYVDTRLDRGYSAPKIAREIAKLFGMGPAYSAYQKHIGSNPGAFSWSDTERRNLAALNYIYQETNKRYVGGRVNQKWKPYQNDINSAILADNQVGAPGTLDNDAPDKDAIKAAKAAAAAARKEAREHKDKLQKDLKAADGQVKSFTKAIDAYYTLQEKAIQELYMQGKINEAEMNRYIALMQSKHDIVASQGRFAIVGDENNFNDVRKQMGKGFDQFDYSSEANRLLGIIQNADPSATGKLIRNLESALGTSPDNSMMNDIRNNGVNSQKSESDRRLKLFQSADSYLNSKNYIDNVGRDFDTILSQAGLTDVGLDKGSKEAAGEDTKHYRTFVNKNGEQEFVVEPEPTESMRMKFIREGVSHYSVDANNTADMRQWLDRLVSKDNKGVLGYDEQGNQTINEDNMASWTQYIPELKNLLLGIGKDADTQLKFLFSTLMQYEDKYYEAKKKNLDYESKIFDSRWTRSADYKQGQEKERELDVKQHIQSIYGRGETGAFLNTQEMARNNGFADNIEGDPEVEKVKLRMVMARKEALLAQQTSDDKELIRQKDKTAQDAELAYADKINSQIKARIDLLQQWVDPLQEFSEAMGDAFVKMTDSAEEGREAMKQATENMVKTFAKMTINMIAQQLKMEVQRALFHKRMQRSESDYMEGMKDANEKGHKSIFKALGSFFKKKKKDTSKNQKEENKEKNKAEKEQTQIVKESGESQQKVKAEVATKSLEISKKTDTEASQTKTEQAAADASTTASETQGNIFAGIASGAAKIIGKLGWWGIPLIAVIQGLLMGLLNSALGKLFGGKNKTASNTNTKLVSGMLTYDSGNVEAFSGAIDKKTYPVVGNDGKVYAAKPTDKLVTGLLTEPIATTVNGQPSLIAERGPEMIIGRETTQALMMARPDIISEIVKFDRNHSGKTYRAYDQGNVSEVMTNLSTSSVSSSQQQATQADMANLLTTMQAMMPAMQAFVRQLQQPLKTSINMYGNGGLYDSMSRANKFMRGKG